MDGIYKMIIEISLNILEKRRNGRNRYLISAGDKVNLYGLQFFNGTRKQAFKEAEAMRDKLILLYCNNQKGGLK